MSYPESMDRIKTLMGYGSWLSIDSRLSSPLMYDIWSADYWLFDLCFECVRTCNQHSTCCRCFKKLLKHKPSQTCYNYIFATARNGAYLFYYSPRIYQCKTPSLAISEISETRILPGSPFLTALLARTHDSLRTIHLICYMLLFRNGLAVIYLGLLILDAKRHHTLSFSLLLVCSASPRASLWL